MPNRGDYHHELDRFLKEQERLAKMPPSAVAHFLGWVTPSDGQATHACRTAFDAYGRRAALRSTR